MTTSDPTPAAETHDPHAAGAPLDRVSRQLTVRALLTGALLGGVLSACNIYTGLTIGWSLNMSIVSILLSYAFWQVLHGTLHTPKWTMLENNIGQTACSSGAAVSSAGLVAPIPALIMLRPDIRIDWHWLALWVFSVCLVGIAVAIPLRKQMIVVDRLPFPSGIANAEMLKEMYAQGREAMVRVRMLIAAALSALTLAVLRSYSGILSTLLTPFGAGGFRLERWGLPFSVKGFSAGSLTFSLDPSLLMIGVGGLIGTRACISLLGGAILAWLVIAPPLVHSGHIRIALTEPLPALPAGVAEQLRPEPEGYALYRPEAGTLQYKGIMSEGERDAYLAMSDDTRWREAIDKLYRRSHIDQDFLADGGYATTRVLRTGVALPGIPEGLTIPRDLRGALLLDRSRGRLVAFGALPPEAARRMRERAEALAAENPESRAGVDAFLVALEDVERRSRDPLDGAALEIPPTLADRVSYDPSGHALSVRGRLSPEDASALQDLRAGDEEFATTVADLAAGTRLSRARPTFNDLVQWLLWPGVTLMVVASLVSFAFSWPALIRAFRGGRGTDSRGAAEDTGEVGLKWFLVTLAAALGLSVILQMTLFSIMWWAAVLGVVLSFVLALVAARVSGETNTTPVGAMGKVTQLVFGALIPSNVVPNLMTANVTGGAASQCADLLHDMKCGYLIGATARKQTVAQLVGALVGSLCGSAVFLVLIPNPSEQLMTEEWAAPAVATWKAVAELFMVGFRALPQGTPTAMLIAGILGIILPVLDRVVPKRYKIFVPSAASLGLAFVINGFNAISMFLGGLLVFALGRLFPSWSKRFVVAICAGLIAGESLTGVGVALQRILFPF